MKIAASHRCGDAPRDDAQLIDRHCERRAAIFIFQPLPFPSPRRPSPAYSLRTPQTVGRAPSADMASRGGGLLNSKLKLELRTVLRVGAFGRRLLLLRNPDRQAVRVTRVDPSEDSTTSR